MIFLPALRFLTAPRPPGAFAARFFAAVMRPPLLFFAMGAGPSLSLERGPCVAGVASRGLKARFILFAEGGPVKAG